MQGHRHSRDLPQGGLEIPCILMFEDDKTFIERVKKLMKFTDLDTKKLSLIAASKAVPMPVTADANSTVDDSCGVTVIVEEVEDTDESTTMCKRRKLDDRCMGIMIRKVMLTGQYY